MPAYPVPLIRRSLGRKRQYVIGQVPQPGLVRKREQCKLEGTTEEFKKFIADVWRSDAHHGCPMPPITVEKYSTAGYALGAVGGCGGYVALWVHEDGHWTEALATQDQWRCADLARYGVPTSFAGKCS
jgi:hypothetical protein